jgi:hypothetical protein
MTVHRPLTGVHEHRPEVPDRRATCKQCKRPLYPLQFGVWRIWVTLESGQICPVNIRERAEELHAEHHAGTFVPTLDSCPEHTRAEYEQFVADLLAGDQPSSRPGHDIHLASWGPVLDSPWKADPAGDQP